MKAAAEGVDIPTTSTKSTKQAVKETPPPAVTTATAAAPIVKANTNSKANRPSGTSVEGPNSGKIGSQIPSFLNCLMSRKQ